MITGTHIRKSYGEKKVLDDVDVTVEPGKITALIGPSGSGKSTLLRSLALIDPPDSGQIQVDDESYDFDSPAPQLISPKPWPSLTIVFQQLHLWPNMTIRQNIVWPLRNNSLRGVSNPDEELEQLFSMFGVHEFLDRFPNEVSIGQRQRAAIIRALALHPNYLLLDEITSALDVEHIAVLLRHLKDVSTRGTGILLITHLIGFAKRAADHVIFMDNGKIEEEGDADILSAPKSERLIRFLSLVGAAS